MTRWRPRLLIVLAALAWIASCQAGTPSIPGPEGGSAPIQTGSASVYIGVTNGSASSGTGGAGGVGGLGGMGGSGGS